jgi:heme-degrading monooxygenase HmoA
MGAVLPGLSDERRALLAELRQLTGRPEQDGQVAASLHGRDVAAGGDASVSVRRYWAICDFRSPRLKGAVRARRERAVFARVSSYDGPAGLSDEEVEQITRTTTERVLPQIHDMAGYRGILTLLDRHSGKALSITLWDSEEDMQASEEAANATRAQAAEIASEQVSGVERYQVTYQEMR